MKQKNISLFTCFLLLNMLGISNAIAQQQRDPVTANATSSEIGRIYQAGDYSYRLLPAPNNSFGYDIYQNKRLLSHQPRLIFPGEKGRMAFVKREQAQKIILSAIEKIKRGRLPILNIEEIKQISSQ